MQASRPSSSAIHLYWDPPFTLDITNVDPDIPGYTVSITNNNTKVTREWNVTEPEFLFQEDHDPCHVYLFRVRAWNPVGVGEKSDVIDKCFGGGWLINILIETILIWSVLFRTARVMYCTRFNCLHTSIYVQLQNQQMLVGQKTVQLQKNKLLLFSS